MCTTDVRGPHRSNGSSALIFTTLGAAICSRCLRWPAPFLRTAPFGTEAFETTRAGLVAGPFTFDLPFPVGRTAARFVEPALARGAVALRRRRSAPDRVGATTGVAARFPRPPAVVLGASLRPPGRCAPVLAAAGDAAVFPFRFAAPARAFWPGTRTAPDARLLSMATIEGAGFRRWRPRDCD